MAHSRRNFLRGLAGAFAAGSVGKGGAAAWARELSEGRVQGNPLVVGVGLCDPHVRVYDGEVYLYATHDADPKNTGFCTHDWWVWHTANLIDWKEVGTLQPQQTYWRKPSTMCWATDAIRRDGRYHFFFSRGPEEIGVVESDSPRGPWHDAMGKPLIAAGSTPTTARDPGILQEEDGTTYIVFGVWEYYIARLADDMRSLAETPRKIVLDRKMGPYGPGKTDDKPYLHKRNGIYYLSWGCYYAMSDSVYGPYVYKDTILTPDRADPIFRDRLAVHKDYDAFTLDRHASFFSLHGQWYFVCNDQGWPGTQMFFRDSVISYLHYRDNGEMEPVNLRVEGVGEYDARTSIAAANYFAATNANVAQCPEGGYEVRGLGETSSLHYPNLRNLAAGSRLSLRASSAVAGGCTVRVYADDPAGRLLATLRLPATPSWSSYRTVSCQLPPDARPAGVRLEFSGHGAERLRLQWLAFA